MSLTIDIHFRPRGKIKARVQADFLTESIGAVSAASGEQHELWEIFTNGSATAHGIVASCAIILRMAIP